MKVLFILVDALRSSYVNNEDMPFLFNLSQKNLTVKKIVPSPGFCERSEIFTGLDIYDTGNFSAIGFMPENSNYKYIKNEISIAKFFSKLNKEYVRKIFNRYREHCHILPRPYLIPYESLMNFALTEDGQIKFIEHDDIFQQLTDSKKTYTLDGFTSLSAVKPMPKNIVSFAENNIKKKIDFIPIYIGEIDMYGHKYGNNQSNMQPFLRDVDNKLKQLHEIAHNNDYVFSVLGDHGMVPVYKKIDIQHSIKKLDLKLSRDYEVFYDSTMARFWFFSEKSKNQIIDCLKKDFYDLGVIITESNALKYRIPLDIKTKNNLPIYGEVIFCCHPGIIISPDYFNSKNKIINGMHGYLENNLEFGCGFYTSTFGNEQIEKMRLLDICKLLCNSLEIELPNNESWERKVL